MIHTGRRQPKGVTLIEILVALFIFLVGICGVLVAIPTGVKSAEWVILQDAAIHLAHSKFAEFRRDRMPWGPGQKYADLDAYLNARHEPLNSNNYREFAHGKGEAFEAFDDVDHYEWKAEAVPVYKDGTATPSHTGGADLSLWKVIICVRIHKSAREFQFTQYMFPYE
jgi:prepilin-type N-terminal cleavage/methylation domain-containing protein